MLVFSLRFTIQRQTIDIKKYVTTYNIGNYYVVSYDWYRKTRETRINYKYNNILYDNMNNMIFWLTS